MSKVDAREFNIRGILHQQGYSIEDYQREYRWETRQITDLLDDLADKFLAYYKPRHSREQGKKYGHYFLGSIIINDEGQNQFIIDGQQRLTSLTLLLIYIHNNLADDDDKALIEPLIFSSRRGKKSFNLNVSERKACMEALLAGRGFDGEVKSESSIANILARYKDIENYFPDGLAGKALPHFVDWLIEKVDVVRITAHSSTDAYTIFETMNDRGLRLTPAEMLKGYLLTNSPETRRKELNDTWKDVISELKSIGNGEDADAIKAWLRSQYAQDTRERKKDADFERIGNEFHRWVRDNLKRLELDEEKKFADFISKDFSFYGKWYKFISAATKFDFAKDNKVEAIHYNAHNNFTLQRTVLLAPLRKEENKPVILRKLRIVSSFLDILIVRHFWNDKSTAYNTMQDTMFSVINEIRSQPIKELINILTQRLEGMEETFDSPEAFRLHGRNTPRVRYLLARMTDYVHTQSGGKSHYHEYITHEVEHIWATNQHGHHQRDFKQEQEFLDYRNRIGGLLLLPGEVNASLNDKPYTNDGWIRIPGIRDESEDKLNAYSRRSDNPLAYSLHRVAYEKNEGFSGFQKFIERSKLKFKAHSDFRKRDLDERQELYRELCKQIWNPEKLRDM